MKTIFSKLHFDAAKHPKTLKVAITPPSINSEYGSLHEGNVVVSIMVKGASQGFQMSTGDVADMIYALEHALEEIHEDTYSLSGEVR